MKKSILFIFSLLLLCSLCAAQVSVSLAPLPGPFLYTNGPNTGGALAFGCIFTFAAGSTTPLATFTDASGTTQNPNPLVLNAGGFGQAWFQSGLLYDIRVVSSGGINCVSGTTQWSARSVNGSLLTLANEWQQPQSFDDPISILAPDLQIVLGSPAGTRTTLDFPPTSQDVILHGPPLTTDDTLLSQVATQSIQNKNFTSGNQINGCGIVNGPGTYLCIANNGSNATILNSLAVLTGAPSTATVATTASSVGIVGVTVLNAGITGNAVIQQSGQGSCIFDGATTAGDLAIPSTINNGQCHDSGVGPNGTVTNQILGQVLVSGTGGLTALDLYGPSVSTSLGGVPTLTVGTGAGAGAVGTLVTGSLDKVGEVIVATGTSPAASGATIFTLTFSSPFATIVSCSITANSTLINNPAGGDNLLFSAVKAHVSLSNLGATPLTASVSSYAWNYICSGY